MSDSPITGTTTFRPRARLLKVIGAELISDEVVALTELVKNAHDADARTVKISFRGVTGPEGVIIIEDDGHGMDLDTLLRSWMEPAGSKKRHAGGRKTTSGRRVLGEKGVGRFAVDKLGSRLELVAWPAESDRELVAWFDWDAYDVDDIPLSDVLTRYELGPSDVPGRTGMRLMISGLRMRWTERQFRRMCSRLARLRTPFGPQDSFDILIETDEFPNLAGEIRSVYLERAPYRLEASFDGCETIEIALDGGEPDTYTWSGDPLTCGPVKVRLFAFDLESEALAQMGSKMDARAWLKQNTGISIYRDGFRLWPYGEPHDDWLRLDQRRVNNPVVRLSNNQVVGYVEIGADTNPDLRDQTNREGLIHDGAYGDLGHLMHKVLGVLENHRLSLRHPTSDVSQAKKRRATDSHVEELLEIARELRGKERGLSDRLSSIARGLSAQQAQYANLAATGHVTASLADQLRLKLVAMRDPATSKRHRDDVGPVMSRAAGTGADTVTEVLRTLSDFLPSEVTRRERVIDIRRELPAIVDRVRDTAIRLGISTVELALPASGALRTEIQIDSFKNILQIVLNNAVEWGCQADSPAIRIDAGHESGRITIAISDSGPGVAEGDRDRIFSPCFSRRGGRGMGLTIARNLVQLAGGTIELGEPGEGFTTRMVISLPRKRLSGTGA